MSVILITGCSSGFGMLSAVEFARRGHNVFASMRNPDRAQPLRDAARGAGASVNVVQLDVTDPSSVERAVASVLADAGRIDILINNAGIGAVAAVEDFDDDEVLRVIDTNFLGVLRVSRAVLPSMRARRSGRVINIGSLSGVVPSPFRGIYSASKAALAAATEAMHAELGLFGIHACVIEPGFFATAIGDNRMQTRRQGSSAYTPLLERYESGDGKTPAGSKREDPQPVVDAILKAALEDEPKRHYLVGKDAETLAGLRKRLPDEEFAAIIARTMPSLEPAG